MGNTLNLRNYTDFATKVLTLTHIISKNDICNSTQLLKFILFADNTNIFDSGQKK